MQPGLNAALWFVAVLALIPLLLWLLRRSPLGAGLAGGHTAAHGAPRPVAVLPLTAQHKLVTVEVGQGEDRLWLVLGVGPQGLRTLHTMSPGHAPTVEPQLAPQATFTQLLHRIRGGAMPPGDGSGQRGRDGKPGLDDTGSGWKR
jgi:flagellar protein FliO/FliZ